MWKRIFRWFILKQRDFKHWQRFRKDYCPRKFKKFMSFLLIASLPLEIWNEMPQEIKQMTMQYIGYVFCSEIETDCGEARITALSDREIVVFDAVCLQKKTEI